MTTLSAINLFAQFVSANPRWDDAAAVDHLVGSGISREIAEDVVHLTPVAFGRTIIDGMGLQLSNRYFYFRGDGSTAKSGELDKHSVFQEAASNATQFRDHSVFKAIASSSPEVIAINQALNSGSQVADLFVGPVAIFTESMTEAGLRTAHDRLESFIKMKSKTPLTSPSIRPPIKRPWWKFW